MLNIVGGIGVLGAAAGLLWFSLPNGAKLSPIVTPKSEAAIAITFALLLALGVGMIILGVGDLLT